MRLLAYAILAYVALGLQMGLAPYMRFRGAAPNLVLLAVIFIASHAPRDPALLGSFGLGLLQDLTSGQQPGLFAFAYAMLAMFVVAVGIGARRERPLTHMALALAGGLLTALCVLVQGWIHPPAPVVNDAGVALPAIRVSVSLEMVRVVYTAALAPLVIGGLVRAKRVFAFQMPRRRIRPGG